MNYEDALAKVARDREQVLVRIGYLDGQADLLKHLIGEEAAEKEKRKQGDVPVRPSATPE